MKKLLAFILTLAAVLSAVQLEDTAEAVSDKVLRLHILAASDSPAHQRLKLKARDAVLELLEPALAQCTDREAAERAVSARLPAIAQAAARAAGQTASAALVREPFDAREYDGFALPCGEYTALRIELEGGGGQNWWCVVFPPLCTALGEEDGEDDAFALFSEDEKELISGGGRIIRFRLLEWLERLLP